MTCLEGSKAPPCAHERNGVPRACPLQIARDERTGNRDPHFALPRVLGIGHRLRFIEHGDAANRKQNNTFRRDARPASHQRMPQLMEHDAAKDYSDQPHSPQDRGRILRVGLRAPNENEQKQKRQMNANFDAKETTNGNRPTAHGHAYEYSTC